jgi:hypothetical protein
MRGAYYEGYSNGFLAYTTQGCCFNWTMRRSKALGAAKEAVEPAKRSAPWV